MNFNGVIATDSGGFQVFSLGFGMEHGIGKIADNIFLERLRNVSKKGEKWIEVDEDGISFRNPLNGSLMRLTPEKSMKIQSNLGSASFLYLTNAHLRFQIKSIQQKLSKGRTDGLKDARSAMTEAKRSLE